MLRIKSAKRSINGLMFLICSSFLAFIGTVASIPPIDENHLSRGDSYNINDLFRNE